MSRASSAKLPKSGSAIRPTTSKRSNIFSSTNDLNVLVSAKNLKVRPKTAWKKSDLERFQMPSRNFSKEEKQKQIEKREDEIRRLELESQKRKRCLQELDMLRDEKFGKNVDPFAEEKAEQESKLLNQALWAKHEQVK